MGSLKILKNSGLFFGACRSIITLENADKGLNFYYKENLYFPVAKLGFPLLKD